MKQHISRALLLAFAAGALAGCSENSWNNDELNGFEVPEPTQVETIEYTMTEADYAAVSSNSANKALAGDAGAAALRAVGSKLCFSDAAPARDYVPAWLGSSSFAYFTLTDGSAVRLTYNTAVTPSEIPAEIESATEYTVSDEDYQTVWGSEDDYIAAFAPSHTASASIPGILLAALPDAAEGDYAVVRYRTSQADPVFSAPSEPEEPGFTLSSVIGTAAVDDDVTINGVVTALCSQGYILTDASGAIFVYCGSKFEENGFSGLAIGDQIVLNGTVAAYNTGLQIANGATFDKAGSQAVSYPAATTFDAASMADIIARTDNALAIYGTMTGTVSVTTDSKGRTNTNIIIDGSAKAQGSPYGMLSADKSKYADGAKVTVTGYLINVAGGRYCNMVATSVAESTASAAATVSSRAATETMPSQAEYAVYTFNGTRWNAATDVVMPSHADYQAMGQRYDNLSDEAPATLLPKFLRAKYPYASEGDVRYVAYFYYASSATTVRCDEYTFNGTDWTPAATVTTQTAQFVRTGGKWIYDPNVTINLPAGKGQEMSTLYYQTCVDWVKAQIDDKTGATYVTSYGNNEYYSGTSAYQGNVDLRAASARAQYAAGYADMTDEQIVATMKQRFESVVMPAALSILHPDAEPIAGVDVIYTINFSAYNGSATTPYVITYKVTGRGQFEFIECTWNSDK
ncbi:hypothetical protein [Paramuribaculum intestinale]|uniref:hypothetical protein n=1 Tax=Paramuribaculum intestinale TaxID=2094151 RepID=UPI0025B1B24D|nr:hypothetical protein [Paramuribaculum intestinale]